VNAFLVRRNPGISVDDPMTTGIIGLFRVEVENSWSVISCHSKALRPIRFSARADKHNKGPAASMAAATRWFNPHRHLARTCPAKPARRAG